MMNQTEERTNGYDRNHHHHHHYHHDTGLHGHYWRKLKFRIKHEANVLFEKVELVPYWIALGMLVLMPTVYLGGERWWLPLTWSLLILAYTVWGLDAWWRGGRSCRLTFPCWAWLLVGMLGVGVLQLLPGKPWVKMLSPHGSEIWSKVNELGVGMISYTVSMAPDLTWQRCSIIGISLAFVILLVNSVRHRWQIQGILCGVTLAALCNAVIAYCHAFSTEVMNITTTGAFSGAFINRNHFGFLMTMGIVSSLGLIGSLAVSRQKKIKNEKNWRKKMISLSVVVFVLITAQLLSLSRGAFLGTALALFVFGGMWLYDFRGAENEEKRQVVALLALVFGAVLVATPYVMELLMKRYESLFAQELTMDARWQVWKAVCRMFKDYWRMGTGLGAFGASVQPYEPGLFPDNIIDHVHNDWLELAVEIGLPLFVVFAVLVFRFWARGLKAILRHEDRIFRCSGLASAACLLGLGLHECFDFNLLAWSNMLVFSAVLAVMIVCSDKHGRELLQEERKALADMVEHNRLKAQHIISAKERHENHKGRWRWRLILAGVSSCMFVWGESFVLKRFVNGMQYANLIHDMNNDIDMDEELSLSPKERLKLIEQIKRSWPNEHYALIRSATINYQMSQKKIKYLDYACEEISRACLRIPGDGNAWLQCARYWEQALFTCRPYANFLKVQELYDWAVSCQPTIRNTVLAGGLAAFRTYKITCANGDESDSVRQKCLDYLNRSLSLGCKNYEMIFPILGVLINNDTKLVEQVADNVEAQKVLLRQIISRHHYDDALRLMARMESIITRPEDKVEMLASKLQVLDMMGRGDGRPEVWEDLKRTKEKLVPYDEIEALYNNGGGREALQKIKGMYQLNNLSPRLILLEAKIESNLGFYEDLIRTLTRLSFTDEALSAQEASSALEYLGDGGGASWREETGLREKFLKDMISIKSSELKEINYNAAMHLESLEREYAQLKTSWAQVHLVSYYAGVGWLNSGENGKAALAFRRCLDLCPQHLWALRRLRKLNPGLLKEEESELMDMLEGISAPLGQLTPAVTWLEYLVSSETITEQHQGIDVLYVLLNGNIINEPLRLSFTYRDLHGFMYSDRVAFNKGEELTWGVGQLITVKRTMQPFVSTLEARGGILSNGPVTVSSHSVRTHAFEVRLEGGD